MLGSLGGMGRVVWRKVEQGEKLAKVLLPDPMLLERLGSLTCSKRMLSPSKMSGGFPDPTG